MEAQNNELKQLLDDRIAELAVQKKELLQTLAQLEKARQQLMYRERMASLGELTAGIAHEVQNPLNFVNNFAEVSIELIDELKEELAKLPGDSSYVLTLADELSHNQQKIYHHGRRASAIVRSMLQHARNNTGERQPVAINALCDECLRLAYHGFRTKDSGFNSELITRFDPAVGSVLVVEQSLGRVLLNLLNNAFYAVAEKKKQQVKPDEYAPQVVVSTRRLNDGVEIKICDNGSGIPASIQTQIFEPFFTTKPIGQGTGLGLSLSYDLITNEHGGTLSVYATEHELTEFVITLPASTGFGVS